MNILFGIVHWVLLIMLVVIGALLALPLLPIPGNLQSRIVQSGSMEPAIKTGSVVFVLPAENYKEGDIITFGAPASDTPTSHRVVSVRAEGGTRYYTTKGDANEDADPRDVPEGEVLGKVLFSIPFLGYVLVFAKTSLGFLLLVVLPALIVIGDEIRKMWREMRPAADVKKKLADTSV